MPRVECAKCNELTPGNVVCAACFDIQRRDKEAAVGSRIHAEDKLREADAEIHTLQMRIAELESLSPNSK